jgi:hypothetical protein
MIFSKEESVALKKNVRIKVNWDVIKKNKLIVVII